MTEPRPAARRSPSRLVLLGHPVRHSISPSFQNAALRAAGLPVTYTALDVPPADLDRRLAELRADGAAGNVTIPHKERVAAICETLTPEARRAGAVNTFWVEDGRLVGANTDIGGFAAAATALLGGAPTNARIALLGAGGAAAGVLCAAEQWPGCEVAIHNRTRARAEALCARFPTIARVEASADAAVRDATLVVNATSVGLGDETAPVAIDRLDAASAVLDLVYRPGGTALVRGARARGLRAMDGLEMLLEQGALAFRLWFGIEPDRRAMRAAVDGQGEGGRLPAD